MRCCPRPEMLGVLPMLLMATLAPPAHARGGGTGGGTVYFTLGGVPCTMNSDGSAKAPLPVGVSGEPSHSPHAGLRWFLQVRDIVGELYPDGTMRRELFAVRGDGNEAFTCRLTDQADVQLFTTSSGYTRWSPGDAMVSWVAARWVGGVLTGAGVYAGTLVFDAGGNVAGLSAQPAMPLIPCAVVNDSGLRPSIRSHDWSPGGTQMVLGARPAGTYQLFIGSVATGQFVLLPTSVPATSPVWSPAGTKIAFMHAAYGGSISTISPNGSGQTLIAKPSGKVVFIQDPCWSPTGSHLIYNSAGSVLNDTRQDVYRATATGGNKTNLTAELNTRSLSGTPARTVAWR